MLGVSAPGLPADPGRTEIALAAGLAAAAGAVDVLAFTRMGQAFASIVTGNLVVAGTAIGQGDPRMLANVALAYKARQEVPWGKAIPEDVFLNDVQRMTGAAGLLTSEKFGFADNRFVK